jgi:hypothetical protein
MLFGITLQLQWPNSNLEFSPWANGNKESDNENAPLLREKFEEVSKKIIHFDSNDEENGDYISK